jgi:hypothetical protein
LHGSSRNAAVQLQGLAGGWGGGKGHERSFRVWGSECAKVEKSKRKKSKSKKAKKQKSKKAKKQKSKSRCGQSLLGLVGEKPQVF